MIYRYCEQCSAGLTQEQWERALYCCMCGKAICKDSCVMPARASPMGELESMIPVRAVRPLQVVGEAISAHPVACSLGAIGAGVAGIAVAPLALVAGQTIMVLGGIVAGVSGYANSKTYNGEYDAGVKLGVNMLVAGAVVYGSSYVLLGAGGVAIAGGLGVGAYSGVKAIAGRRKLKRITVREPLLLEGGYDAG